jgi:hypothetical protein
VVQAWRDTVLKTNSAKYLDTREMAGEVAGLIGRRDRADLSVAGHPEHLSSSFVCSNLLRAGLQRCSNWNPFDLANAHFSHDTPRIFGLDLPFACFPRAREPGSTPSNRRAPQVCRQAPKIDLGLLNVELHWKDEEKRQIAR